MLSDEEKKAIESLIEIREFANLSSYKDIKISQLNAIDVVLNLIEKQSKEIEHQKEKRENQRNELAILNAKQIEFNKLVNTVNSYKGQFKRQEKEIEELKEERKKYPIAMNDKQYKKVIELAQKDIKEELDRQINARIVNEEFIETNFISKDKIKAKIEEYEEQEKDEPNAFLCKRVLQSLLEKE